MYLLHIFYCSFCFECVVFIFIIYVTFAHNLVQRV